MVANVTGPAAIRNNINSLRVPHGMCEKCNGVIYLQQLGCGRCLRSAQKLNENNSSDSFECSVQNVDEVGYNYGMPANTNQTGMVAANNEQREARVVEARWLCVGRYREEDGTGNVFRLNDDGTEYRWFVEGLPFEAQAYNYVTDRTYYDVRPVAVVA